MRQDLERTKAFDVAGLSHATRTSIEVVRSAYQIASGWNLDVDEQDALVAATRAVGFPVGHASAQMGWRGLLSRPTWRILLYSAENPPRRSVAFTSRLGR